MTTTLNTSRSENTMVLSARVSAGMYFLVMFYNKPIISKDNFGNSFSYCKNEETVKICV